MLDLFNPENFNNTGQKWLQGHIIKPVGPLSYLIKLKDSRIFRRHVDHLRKCFISQDQTLLLSDSIPDFSDVNFPDQVTRDDPDSDQRRYPQRDRRLPERYRP